MKTLLFTKVLLTLVGWLFISFSWTSEDVSAIVPSPSLQEKQPIANSASETKKLPPNIQSAVLSEASQLTSQAVAGLRITEAEERTWSNSCLGLPEPDQLCAQVLTPGWQVVVTDGKREWVYRTDTSGNLVKLEESPR